MYKDIPDMPTSGRFIGIWKINDNIWSRTFQWNDGALQWYQPAGVGWKTDTENLQGLLENKRSENYHPVFVVLEG